MIRLKGLNSIPAVLFLFIASCGLNHETNVESGTRAGTLHVGNGDEPRELDPHVVTGSIEHNLCMALLEGLLGRDPETCASCPVSPAPGR